MEDEENQGFVGKKNPRNIGMGIWKEIAEREKEKIEESGEGEGIRRAGLRFRWSAGTS